MAGDSSPPFFCWFLVRCRMPSQINSLKNKKQESQIVHIFNSQQQRYKYRLALCLAGNTSIENRRVEFVAFCWRWQRRRRCCVWSSLGHATPLALAAQNTENDRWVYGWLYRWLITATTTKEATLDRFLAFYLTFYTLGPTTQQPPYLDAVRNRET